jgi:hypothetical protein
MKSVTTSKLSAAKQKLENFKKNKKLTRSPLKSSRPTSPERQSCPTTADDLPGTINTFGSNSPKKVNFHADTSFRTVSERPPQHPVAGGIEPFPESGLPPTFYSVDASESQHYPVDVYGYQPASPDKHSFGPSSESKLPLEREATAAQDENDAPRYDKGENGYYTATGQEYKEMMHSEERKVLSTLPENVSF